MKKLVPFLALLLLSSTTIAQSIGPDVIVGSLSDVGNYGTTGTGIYAYSLGTTSCNIGTVDLGWIASINQHPVIGQNIYRLKNGRFEQIGMSWLKHGFTALTGTLCGGPCNSPGTGSLLGIGCSDPYSAGLNGSQGNGPRNEVNPSTGVYLYPIGAGYPSGSSFGAIGRRIQCAQADVDPALNAGALYFGEGQYVAPDDARAGNQNNNASYRQMTFAAGTFNGALTGPTVQQLPAVHAWQAADASVSITNVDWPNDGRFKIAKKVTNLGGGNFHFEFAVHNLNSDRAARGFTVSFPVGTVISNPGFKDINYHSGEPYSGTDWTITNNGDSINWATDTWATNPNANALRWGTLYNFWFNATASAETSAELEPFKCPADVPVKPTLQYVLNMGAAFDNPPIAGAAGPSGDNVSLNVPIGFTFSFYGTTYTTVYISTNGFLTFVNSSTTVSHNTGLPVATNPNATIAGYWDNLTAAAGQITYQTIGVAPNRRFVVHYNNVTLVTGGSAQNFKIILDETTNVVTSTIISCAGNGTSATRGIESQNGQVGIQASLNTSGTAPSNSSWTFTPTYQVLPSADLAVGGSSGPNGTLTWTVDANANSAPVIIIASLDPGPTNIGAFGNLLLGFTPGQFAVVADGAGLLQPADPAHVTTAPCGTVSVSINVGPMGLPSGMTVFNQGVVISTAAPAPPNGAFHLTDMEILNT